MTHLRLWTHAFSRNLLLNRGIRGNLGAYGALSPLCPITQEQQVAQSGNVYEGRKV